MMNDKQERDRFVGAGYSRADARRLVALGATISVGRDQAEAVLERRAAKELAQRVEDMETMDCYVCGGTMHRATRMETVEYAGLVSPEFEAPLFRCGRCGEEMATGKDMMVTERQMNVLKARAQVD